MLTIHVRAHYCIVLSPHRVKRMSAEPRSCTLLSGVCAAVLLLRTSAVFSEENFDSDGDPLKWREMFF